MAAGSRLARLICATITLVFLFGCGCEDQLVGIPEAPPTQVVCDPATDPSCVCPPENPGCHDACEDDAGCPEHHCCLSPAEGEPAACAFCPRGCVADTECCPGQTCNENLGRCFDKFDECTVDADCGRVDRICTSYTDPGPGGETTNRCDYAACTGDAECGIGMRCFSERCVLTPPCGGGCRDGEVCVLANDRCQEDPLCTATACTGGFIMVYDDPDNVYDGASCRERPCHCQELPPLSSDDQGRYAASGFLGGKVLVSAYDGAFGDLVLHTIDPVAGRIEGTEWVDGVPATGQVVGGPSGARGGIADPGPEVGRYTDLVVGADGAVHVSYYDSDEGDLKYARRDGAGAWTSFTVDGSDGSDVGLFTSIALSADGGVAIAYFQRAGAAGSEFLTGLKVARAATGAPAAAADFTVSALLDPAGRPPPPCNGACAAGSACLDDGANGSCTATVTGCDSDPGTPALEGCATGDACADLGAGPVCQATLKDESLAGDLPQGSGLFPSLAFRGSDPVIFYFSSLDSSLRAIEGAGGGFNAPLIVEGGIDAGGVDTGNTGWYPSVAVAPDLSTVVVYSDQTNHSLVALAYAPGSVNAAPALREVANPGIGIGEVTLVGADASVVITANGDWLVAYQDQSFGDLLVSRRDRAAGAWGLPERTGDGPLGFFPDVVLDGTTAYVTHTRIKAGIPDLESHVEMIPAFDAP